jgi:hypothetical protein
LIVDAGRRHEAHRRVRNGPSLAKTFGHPGQNRSHMKPTSLSFAPSICTGGVEKM